MQLQPLVPLVDEFAARLFTELDYVQEGANAERFQVRFPSCAGSRSDPVLQRV